MPELPEVEVLVRHLALRMRGRRIRRVTVRRARVVAPCTPEELSQKLRGATFQGLTRRAKYLLFAMRGRDGGAFTLLGHLGMTGRMYWLPAKQALPKHAAVILHCGPENFVFEDTRYFGRFTIDPGAIASLGPEPLGGKFTAEYFFKALKSSRQPIKVKLLDQQLVAGVGNIYASEALFRAGISPLTPARGLKRLQVVALRRAIRATLRVAIKRGSTLPLNFSGTGNGDGLFYYGSPPGESNFTTERLRVYDRAGKPCRKCRTAIERIVQAARSTFYCPQCQSQVFSRKSHGEIPSR